jgi:hypothetical protein
LRCAGQLFWCGFVSFCLAAHRRTAKSPSTELPCPSARSWCSSPYAMESAMNSIIYLVGLVVVVMAILSFVGIH